MFFASRLLQSVAGMTLKIESDKLHVLYAYANELVMSSFLASNYSRC